MKILIIHPSGNQNTRQALQALKKKNLIYSFITSINFNIEKFYYNFLPKKIIKNLNRRYFNEVSNKVVSSSFFFQSQN